MDWIAGILELIAIYLLGRKMKAGFVVSMCCGATWCMYVFTSGGSYGLLLVTVPAFFLNVKGYLNWRKNDA